jgi:hypothetical protein
MNVVVPVDSSYEKLTVNWFFSAKLKADIVLSPDYPYQTPTFALSLDWQSSRTNTNDENIRVSRYTVEPL